jgi:phosphoribosylformimino-5-aminoimidazole carboxamide ribotide isomerase
MILFPSIDLKDGYMVRYLRGVTEGVLVENTDPADQAVRFEEQGFRWLHVVDLNGATTGRMDNAPAVEAILEKVSIPIQLGGGIRDLKTMEFWLEKGVRRIILGTVAQRNPSLVREACQKFPGRIAVSIDAMGGQVAVSGWTQTTGIKAVELALRFEDVGVAAIIYTDIGRNGTLGGINVDAISDLAFALTTPLIAAGGLASLADIAELKKEEAAGIVGLVCGRALHDGRVDPAEALALAGSQMDFV